MDFRGTLRVTDRAKFKAIFHGRPEPQDPGRLICGLGSAKGFGFGMLALAPAD